MVIIQLVEAKPEYCREMGLSFPVYNFISDKIPWPSMSLGPFHKDKRVIMAVML